MVPFYYLHAELETEYRQKRKCRGPKERSHAEPNTSDRYQSPAPSASTRLSLYGKDTDGGSVVVHIHGYRIHFYASFKDPQLCRHCCAWLARQNASERLVVAIESVNGFKSMLINKRHQASSTSDDYADTTLTNVCRIRVRTRRDIKATIEVIYDLVYRYYSSADNRIVTDDYTHAVRFYESNLDTITVATRRLGLDACRWICLNTALCSRDEALGAMSYEFYDNGVEDPAALFATATSVVADAAPCVTVMSFDIECLSSDVETMPDATRDPVIQISSVVARNALDGGVKSAPSSEGGSHNGGGDEGPLSTVYSLHRRLYTTGGTCDPIPGVTVHAFSREKDMLQAFVDHMFDQDPDIVTGYNVCTFDFPYLFSRFAANGVLARLGKERTVATCKRRSDRDASRQYASYIPKTHDTRIPGRVVFDMYTHVRKEVNLRSYTLNSVAAHFLSGRKKDEIGYREIPTLFNGDGTTRARLGRYCVKDAQLVLEIAFETQTFVHAFERCKVFRTMLQYMVDRGQQVRFYSLLLAWCTPLNILVNDVTTCPAPVDISCRDASFASGKGESTKRTADKKVIVASERRQRNGKNTKRTKKTDGSAAFADTDRDDDDDDDDEANSDNNRTDVPPLGTLKKTRKTGYDGATVLDPIRGIYYTPVLCLDYASLYPSIMIAHNLCFTTFVSDERHGADLTRAGLAERSPIGHYFLTSTVKKGVLPSILEMLLNERAAIRARMKDTTDVTAGSIEYRMFDGQQSALKLAANSIYGAIGCEASALNMVQIPSSVTAYGRDLIALTKRHVEECYEGSRVVYGDTDSVMVNLERWDSTTQRIWECAAIGKGMAVSTTRLIARPPIRLQFETVYRPFLLCTKKRYAAGVYSDLDSIAATAASSERSGDSSPTILCPRPNIKFKGLQVVRRDNCTFATRLMRFALETLMDEKGDAVQRVTDGLRTELERLFGGRINMKELVISKEWKKRCATGQPQDHLARRMQERDSISAPRIGDRVPYVVVTVPNGGKLCERAEDPLYVLENGLKPDYLYYADNQVAKPIAELLRVVLPHGRSLEDVKDSFWPTDAPRRATDRRPRHRGPGEKNWMKKASVYSRLLTDCGFVRTERPVETKSSSESTEPLADIEDVLDGLAERCMNCKNGEVEAIRSCRDRDCETLYERFCKLEERRKALRGAIDVNTESELNNSTASDSQRLYVNVYDVQNNK